jgi:hypothetical protein
MNDSLRCSEVHDLIPELAAGVASGEERAKALAHLADCTACRRELDETAAVVDDLLLLAPSKEPPPSFETAVLGRLGLPRSRARRRGRVLQFAAALVIVAMLGVGATMWTTARERELAAAYERTLAVANGEYFTAREVTTGSGREVGHLFAYEGSPSWIFVTIANAPTSGSHAVQLVTKDGDERRLDECILNAGGGSCGGEIDVPLREILLIRLTKPGEPGSLVAHF